MFLVYFLFFSYLDDTLTAWAASLPENKNPPLRLISGHRFREYSLSLCPSWLWSCGAPSCQCLWPAGILEPYTTKFTCPLCQQSRHQHMTAMCFQCTMFDRWSDASDQELLLPFSTLLFSPHSFTTSTFVKCGLTLNGLGWHKVPTRQLNQLLLTSCICSSFCKLKYCSCNSHSSIWFFKTQRNTALLLNSSYNCEVSITINKITMGRVEAVMLGLASALLTREVENEGNACNYAEKL